MKYVYEKIVFEFCISVCCAPTPYVRDTVVEDRRVTYNTESIFTETLL